MMFARQQVKSGIAVFGSASLLAVVFNSCNGDCKAAVEKDKLSALIGQLQGNCCVYEADPYWNCEKHSDSYKPIPWLPYRCVSSAAQCLGAMGKEANNAVPALIEAMEKGPNNYNTGDGPIPARDHIIIALGKIGDPRAVKPLIAALNSPRPIDSGFFPRSSSKIGPKGYDGTIEALGLLGPAAKEAVPHIIPFLKSSDSYLFRAATKALAQIKDPSAIPPLIEALSHPTDAGLAAYALKEFGSQAKPAVPILIEMIEKSPNMEGSVLVIEAIRKISGNMNYLPEYDYKEMEAWRASFSVLNKHLKNKVISLPVKGVYYATLPNQERLYVKLKHTATNPDSEAGEIWLEKNGKENYRETFSTFTEMQDLFEKKLTTRLREATDK